jgi:hypothetical protein
MVAPSLSVCAGLHQTVQTLRQLLDHHGPACVCTACQGLTQAEHDLSAIDGMVVRLIEQAHRQPEGPCAGLLQSFYREGGGA